MKISTISHAISRKFMPILTTVAMAVPMKTANSTMRVTAQTQDKFVSIINSITPSDLKGLKVIKEVNFKGGVINKFDSASVEKLKQKINQNKRILTIIATIIDPPATMLNVVGDSASSMMVARIVDGKKWMKEKKLI